MHDPLKLSFPVSTLDRKELLPAGTRLTEDVLQQLIRSDPMKIFPSMRLMEHGSIAADVNRICKRAPYNQIFSNALRKKDVFDAMGRVELNQPLLDIYDYFKSRDPYTYVHMLTVFALSLLLAQDLIDNRAELAREVAAAPTHDFGKICVPAGVLRKSTPLTASEQLTLSQHAAAGYVILGYYLKDPDHPAAIAARDHHERCDGSGYPRGIKLRSKVVEIVAVGDVFDALISPRPYRRRSYELRAALEELTAQADRGALSRDVVKALVCCNRKDNPQYTRCRVSREKRSSPPSDNLYKGTVPGGDG